jgi:hypothetical protein
MPVSGTQTAVEECQRIAHGWAAMSEIEVATSKDRPREPWRVRLQRFAYRKLPGLFDSPDMKYDLEWHRGRDKEENEACTPQTNEHIDLLCFWAVEFYLPSHIAGLVSSFVSLGWDHDRAGDDRNPIGWLQHSRSRTAGGWMSFDLTRPGERRIFGRSYSVSELLNVPHQGAAGVDRSRSVPAKRSKGQSDPRQVPGRNRRLV